MGEGLAILAIAHHPRAFFRLAQVPSKRAAFAAQWTIHWQNLVASCWVAGVKAVGP
jgi:hypothetical protein